MAIVTGSDSGIGQGIAVEFGREGASLVVHYFTDEAGARETRRQVEALGAKATIVQADVTKPEEIDSIFRACHDAFGTPDILVNNAGIDASGIPVAELPLERWEQALRTNLTAPFLCCQRFVREAKATQKRGRIINITSVHQDIPRVGAADYDVSKGGLRNLTTTLALELAPDKINVNSIAPGMVLTPMNKAALEDPKKREEQVQSIPWKRAAEPWEVARLAVYLASKDAEYVTGATYVIDGGLTLNQGQGA